MLRFLLFVLLLVVCWPLALVAVVLYPLVWLIGLPFRILGRTVSATIDLVLAIVLFPLRLPGRVLRAI